MKEIRRQQNASEDRPKSHSPSTTTLTSASTPPSAPSTAMTSSDPRKKFDSSDRKSTPTSTSSDRRSKLVDSFDRGSPPDSCCNANNKSNGSWSSADSVQHFPERDTSRQVEPTFLLNIRPSSAMIKPLGTE